MYTEGTLEEMVNAFRDIHVQSRIGPLQLDLLQLPLLDSSRQSSPADPRTGVALLPFPVELGGCILWDEGEHFVPAFRS